MKTLIPLLLGIGATADAQSAMTVERLNVEARGEGLTFRSIFGAALTESGNVVVASGIPAELTAFDSTGKQAWHHDLRDLPLGGVRVRGGVVAVLARTDRWVIREYAVRDGAMVRELDAGIAVSRTPRLLGAGPDGWVIHVPPSDDSPDGVPLRHDIVLIPVSGRGQTLRSVPDSTPTLLAPLGVSAYRYRSPLAPRLSFGLSAAGHLFLAFGAKPEVIVYTGQDRDLVIPVANDALPMAPESVAAFLEEWIRNSRRPDSVARKVVALSNGVRRTINGLSVAPAGDFLAARLDHFGKPSGTRDSSYYDLVRQGATIGRIALKPETTILAFDGRRMVVAIPGVRDGKAFVRIQTLEIR
jgi:hypothetical protein